MNVWLKRLVAAVLVPLVVLVFVPLASVLYVVVRVLRALRNTVLYAVVWTWWIGTAHLRVLVVTSESPNWQEHMEREVLPRMPPRTVVLNWSRRKHWSRLAFPVMLFHAFAGDGEFNPMVMVFRRCAAVETFRLWQPFRDARHGRDQALRALQERLFESVRE